MKKLILVVTVVIISFAFLSADVHFKMETIMTRSGQPAQTIPQEQWLGKNKMAISGAVRSMIIDMETKKFYIVMNNTKTYIETDLPLDVTKIMPEAYAPMLKQAMDSMTFSMQANGKTKKILDWNTNGYAAKLNMMAQEYVITFWASKDVPFDWKKYKEIFAEYFKAQLKLGDKALAEFLKMEGYVLAFDMSVSSMGGKIDINTVTTSIDPKAKPPAGIYSPPAGYSRQERMTGQ